ncbi:MAG: hypothetical protein EOO14_21205, partial [Chitinophagaceae bacterium]
MNLFFTLLISGISLLFTQQNSITPIENNQGGTQDNPVGISIDENLMTNRISSAATALFDNLEDGNLTANPVWEGNTGAFVVSSSSPLAGSFDLRSNTAGTSSSIYTRIGTASNLADGAYTWEFLYKDIVGAPSTPGTNGWRFFLAATSGNIATAQGYAIRHGNTGSPDNIELVVLNGSTETVLINSNIDPGTAAYSIKVTRSAAGNWSLFMDPGTGTATTQRGATVNHTTYFATGSSDIFLLLYGTNSTSGSNPQRFRWDNILFKKVTMQASLRNGMENEVSVYLKPSASFSHKDEKLNIALAV